MEETDIKMLMFISSIIGSIVAAVVGAVLFFWREAREKYRHELSAMRMLVVITSHMTNSLDGGNYSSANADVDMLVAHSDILIHDARTLAVVCKLVRIMAIIDSNRIQGKNQVDLSDVGAISALHKQSIKILRGKLHSLIRIILLL